MDKEVFDYLPEFKGTNWDGISMLDAANMATALQLEETLDAIVDTESIIVRFFSAEFGAPNPATGKVENWLSILKEAEKIEGEAPGYRFRYSSAVTQIFVVIAERIENKAWAKIFEERVWGNMTARLSIQHLTEGRSRQIIIAIFGDTIHAIAVSFADGKPKLLYRSRIGVPPQGATHNSGPPISEAFRWRIHRKVSCIPA
jgi:hypothetical protein